MTTFIRYMAWSALGLYLIYFAANATNGVSFNRIIYVDNNPLTNPIKVEKLNGNRLFLGDGRVLVVDDMKPIELKRRMTEADYLVDVEEVYGDEVYLEVKQPYTYCGTHAPRIVIPIRPVKVARNRKAGLCFARVE